MNSNLAVILAGGTGTRVGGEEPKQFSLIGGKEILVHTVEAFERHSDIHSINIVIGENYIERVKSILKREGFKKIQKIVVGGAMRQDSSREGVLASGENFSKILIHDAARPFVSEEIINRSLEALEENVAVNVSIASRDTIVRVDSRNRITEVPDRKDLRLVQTPQGFRGDTIRGAHKRAFEEGYNQATDDCSLILKYKLGDVVVVEGEDTNIKITYPMDLDIAEMIIKNRF